MEQELINVYGNRIRVRVCGMCWNDGRLLLVNHAALGSGDFWAPPGGGMEFGATVDHNLARELLEETGLEVKVGDFMFACEYLKPPLHSIELFFAISVVSGQLAVGNDPELPIIKDVRFIGEDELAAFPDEHLHGILRVAKTETEFKKMSGFYRI